MGFDVEKGLLKAYHEEPGVSRVVIPQDVTVIGRQAFYGCQSLVEVEIPRGVEHIAKAAFLNCTGLRTVTVAQGTIGDHAFEGCAALEEAAVGPEVTSVGVHAFSDCGRLRRLSIAPDRTRIGSAAFKGCNALADENGFCVVGDVLYDCAPREEACIPEGVREISALAFGQRTGLREVRMPKSVVKIGAKAFWGCTSLRTATLSENLTRIGECAFLNCTSLREIEIPGGVSVLPGRGGMDDSVGGFICIPGVFDGCVSLRHAGLSRGLEQIGIRAFGGCVSLSSLTIPDSVTEIGFMAFSDCRALGTIRLSPHVKRIGGLAFPKGIERILVPAMPDGPEKTEFLRRIRGRVSQSAQIIQESEG